MRSCVAIMQGDQYALSFRISCRGQPLTDSTLSGVEIVIGTLRKATPEVAYNAGKGTWDFPLTQAETFALSAEPARAQARLLFPDGSVIGRRLGMIQIVPSASKEVLTT